MWTRDMLRTKMSGLRNPSILQTIFRHQPCTEPEYEGEQNTGRSREKERKSFPRLPCLIFLTLWTDRPSALIIEVTELPKAAKDPVTPRK